MGLRIGRSHAFLLQLFDGIGGLLQRANAHTFKNVICLGELDVVIGRDLDPVAQGSRIFSRSLMLLTPSLSKDRFTASRSSTTKPKWRLVSGTWLLPRVSWINWSPRSINALCALLPRSLNSKIAPYNSSALAKSSTSSTT